MFILRAFKKIFILVFVQMATSYYRKFVKDTDNAVQVEKDLLNTIVSTNKDTAYGRQHHFAEIKSSSDYKRLIPLTTYQDYEKYIERAAMGEQNLLTTDPVDYFALSSGTTGKQKLIPITKGARRIVTLHQLLLVQGVLFSSLPKTRSMDKGLMIMNAITSGKTAGGILTGSASAGGMRAMKWINQMLWVSPDEILDVKSQRDANYFHLLFALREKKLMYINTTFANIVLQLFRQLEQEWPDLISDIRNGTISNKIKIEQTLRERIMSKLSPDPKRADELEYHFQKGLANIVIRIWPNIQYFGCVSGGSFQIYVDPLKHYIGSVPITSAVYAASEAMIGVAIKPGLNHYIVTPRTAFHEFIPLDEVEAENPQCLSIDELTRGNTYEIVVTSLSGFYRYRLGDIVKVVDFFGKSPVLEYLYRQGQLLDIAGEKSGEQAVYQAITQTLNQSGIGLVDYSTGVDISASPGQYIMYLEIDQEEKSMGLDSTFLKLLDDNLGVANPRYLANRNAGKIGLPQVLLLRSHTFENLRRELVEEGSSENQVKIPRNAVKPKHVDFLKNNSTRILK